MRFFKSFLILALMIAVFPRIVRAQDPGVPDTVKIDAEGLYLNQSHPVMLTIVNDYPVAAATLGFVISSIDGGFAGYDSVVYVGRLADPEVWGYRTVSIWDNDGVSPDSILTGGFAMALTRPLPPGNDPIMELYYTGNGPGQMAIDSGFLPPGGYFLLVQEHGVTYTPQFTTSPITVQEGNPPPSIELSSESPQVAVGEEIVIEVSGESPVDPAVTLELVSLNGYDDDVRLPSNPPTFGSTNPAEFRWTPAADDIGIWEVTFRACDFEGTCTDRRTDIQVVENAGYLISFDFDVTPDACYSSGLMHGNFSVDDDNPEVVVTGTGHGARPFQLFSYNPPAGLELAYEIEDFDPLLGPEVGYFDDDEFLDVVLRHVFPAASSVKIYHGTGQDSFTATATPTTVSSIRGSCLGEFTGDGFLEYATVRLNTVYIYDGGSEPQFQLVATIPVTGEGLSLTSADFDEDGRDDLAVGTEDGVYIYLGDGAGGFAQAHFYSQVYGSMDIDVTNEGSDFNGDGYFDLCISTPSVGGEFSEMVVYLGNGDGSFQQTVVRTVRGQIFGNCVGDFNGDGELDIGYINGARGHAAILFGDGDGTFTNELRYAIPHEYIKNLDCLDIDLDGDIDLTVVANLYSDSKVILMTNTLDPEGFAKRSFTISGCNNSDISLISASGLELNSIRKTMPSGQFFRRRMDGNSIIDQFGTLALVEDGCYTLDVHPRPNLPLGEPFTVEFSIDGELYRLARDVPMTASGYQFSIYAGGASDILPQPGRFISVNPPTFYWQTSGEYDFQLASDIDFTDVLYETVVSGSSYSPPSVLPVGDTATFYWRVKPHARSDYDRLYVVNLVSGGSSSCGDANGDASTGIADVVYLLNYMFKGGPAPEPLCVGDADGNGEINIGDAVYVINYVFKGGPMPVIDCCP